VQPDAVGFVFVKIKLLLGFHLAQFPVKLYLLNPTVGIEKKHPDQKGCKCQEVLILDYFGHLFYHCALFLITAPKVQFCMTILPGKIFNNIAAMHCTAPHSGAMIISRYFGVKK
jgi:hypothetical protein